MGRVIWVVYEDVGGQRDLRVGGGPWLGGGGRGGFGNERECVCVCVCVVKKGRGEEGAEGLRSCDGGGKSSGGREAVGTK